MCSFILPDILYIYFSPRDPQVKFERIEDNNNRSYVWGCVDIPAIEEMLTIVPPFPPLSFPNLASEILLRSITAF